MAFDTEVTFGADAEPLKEGVADADKAVAQALDHMSDSIKEFHNTVKEATEGIIAKFLLINQSIELVQNALKGGEAFEKFVEKTTEMAEGAHQLAFKLGITAEEAGVLNAALKINGASTEQYLGVNQRLQRQLKSNETGLNAMGIATRDANGEMLTGQQVMSNSLTYIAKFKEGNDQSQAAIAVFGGRVGDLSHLLRANAEDLDEVRRHQEALGTTVTQDDIDRMITYHKAIAKVGETMDGFYKVVGDLLIPILTDLSNWFNDNGPAAVKIFKNAIDGLVITFNGIIMSATLVKDAIEGIWMMLDVKAHGGDVTKTWNEMLNIMEFDARTMQEKLDRILNPPPKTPAKKEEGGDTWHGNNDKNLSEQIKIQQEILNNKFAADKDRIASELQVWAIAKETGKATEDELLEHKRLALAEEYKLAVKHQQDLLQLEYQRPAKKGEDKGLANQAAQIKAQGVLNSLHAKYLSDDAAAEGKAEVNAEKAAAASIALSEDALQAKQKMDLQEVDSKVKAIEAMKDAGKASELDVLAAQREAIAERLKLEADFMLAKNELDMAKVDADSGDNKEARKIAIGQKTAEAINLAYAKANSEMVVNSGKAAEAINKNNTKLLADFTKMINPLTGAWDKALMGMLDRTMSWHKAQQTILLGVVKSFDQMGIQILNDFIKNQAKKLLQTQAGAAAEAAIHKAAVALGLATETAATPAAIAAAKAQAVGVIPAEIGTAAMGAAASVASIPYVGPGLAAAAYDSMLELGGTAMGMASAEGGYDIPSGINPVTQLHQREMVLPSSLADNVRNMSGGSSGDVHFHISAMDGHSVKQFFNKHGSTIMDTIQRQGRSFNFGSANRP